MKKQWIAGLVLGLSLSIASSGLLLAEDPAAGASPAANAQVQELKEAAKAKRQERIQQVKAERQAFRKQMSDLASQRDTAVKAGNQDQVKALTQQMQSLKKERRAKMKEARKQAKENRKAFRKKVHQAKKSS